jgi:hypothetical protein
MLILQVLIASAFCTLQTIKLTTNSSNEVYWPSDRKIDKNPSVVAPSLRKIMDAKFYGTTWAIPKTATLKESTGSFVGGFEANNVSLVFRPTGSNPELVAQVLEANNLNGTARDQRVQGAFDSIITSGVLISEFTTTEFVSRQLDTLIDYSGSYLAGMWLNTGSLRITNTSTSFIVGTANQPIKEPKVVIRNVTNIIAMNDFIRINADSLLIRNAEGSLIGGTAQLVSDGNLVFSGHMNFTESFPWVWVIGGSVAGLLVVGTLFYFYKKKSEPKKEKTTV